MAETQEKLICAGLPVTVCLCRSKHSHSKPQLHIGDGTANSHCTRKQLHMGSDGPSGYFLNKWPVPSSTLKLFSLCCSYGWCGECKISLCFGCAARSRRRSSICFANVHIFLLFFLIIVAKTNDRWLCLRGNGRGKGGEGWRVRTVTGSL